MSWIVTYVADWFKSGDLPVIGDLAKELGMLGLVGMHLRGYRCAGMAVDLTQAPLAGPEPRAPQGRLDLRHP